jgi:hypothetical protein
MAPPGQQSQGRRGVTKMPIASKHVSAEDVDDYSDEIDLPGPNAEQRARMRAGPRIGKPAKPDFKSEEYAKSVFKKFNAKPKSDESPRKSDEDEE